MALTIGELVAHIDLDDTGMTRGLTNAELAMRGFERDASGRLHRLDGSLVETAVAAREMGAEVVQSADRARLATIGLQRDASGTLRDVRGRYVSAGDAAERFGHQMLGTAHTASQSLHSIATDADHALGHRGVAGRASLASSALGGLRAGLGAVATGATATAARMAPMLAQFGSAVPLIAGLVGTLESIVPAATVAATGILAVVTVTGTLKLAMHGVGDAVKAAFDPGTKPEDLKKALDGLAPPARQFVLALRSLQPQLKALQQSVQGEFFAGLGAQIKTLANAALPTLRVQLGNMGMVLNGMATGAIQAATKLSRDGTFGKALDGVTNGLYDLQAVPGQVVTALGQLAAAGAPLFQRLTAAAGNAATGISAKLSAAFKSGGLSSAIDTAVGVIKQLGAVLGNVGSIIGSVFAAAGSAGGSWLGILEQITGAAAKAFQQPGVQAALSALFSTMRVLGETVGPLVAQALGVIAPILTTLAPPAQVLIRALGSALSPIIKALGPVLLSAAQAVGKLVVALSPLITVAGDLIAQLLPILVPVLDLLTGVFTDLAGPIKQIATALGKSLKPVIKGLSLVVQDLVDQYLSVFLDLLSQLTPMIPVLTPVLLQLGKSFGEILAAVAPLLPQLATMTIMFIAQLLPAILPLIPPLAQLTTMLLILATDVITKVVVPALQGLIDFMSGLMSAFQPAIDAVKWLTTSIASLFEWLADHLVGHSVIPDMVRSIVGWFAGLPGKAIAALGDIAGRLGRVMVDATDKMINATSTGLKAVVSWISDLPGRVKGALGDIGNLLYKSGQALLDGFARGIKSMGGIVKSAAGSVLGGVSKLFPHSPAEEGPFSGRGYPLYSGQAIGEALAAGMTARVDHVRRAAATLMGGAAGALGGPAVAGFGAVGVAGAYGGGVASGGPQKVVVQFDVTGADQHMLGLIRSMVRAKAGGGSDSVQRAFG